jgi:hypothetical protein
MCSLVCLQVPRFFLSPVGYTGAVSACLSFTLAFISTALQSAVFLYVPAALGPPPPPPPTTHIPSHPRHSLLAVVLWLVVGGSYYGLYARFHMRLGPEEAFSLASRVTAEKMLATGLGYAYLLRQCEAEFSAENITCEQRCQD